MGLRILTESSDCARYYLPKCLLLIIINTICGYKFSVPIKWFFMYCASIFWAIVSISAFCLELCGPGFWFCCAVGFGALGALLAAFTDYDFIIQSSVFVGIAACAFYSLRQLAKKLLPRVHLTNGQALIGQKTIVQEKCMYTQPGLVRLAGSSWSAYTIDENQVCVPGDTVEVVAIRGCHMIVKKIRTTKE